MLLRMVEVTPEQHQHICECSKRAGPIAVSLEIGTISSNITDLGGYGAAAIRRLSNG
jgi:hypothetical protein